MMKRLTLHTVCTLWAGLAHASTVWNPTANGVFPPPTANWNVAGNWTQKLPSSVANGKAALNVANAAECRVTNTQTCGPFLQSDNGPGNTTVRAVAGQFFANWHVAGAQCSTNALIITPFDAVADFGILVPFLALSGAMSNLI
jgi:hypothetical protein